MTSTLSKKTIEWTLEHFARHNDTDIFHKPFEFQAIIHNKDDLIKKTVGARYFPVEYKNLSTLFSSQTKIRI